MLPRPVLRIKLAPVITLERLLAPFIRVLLHPLKPRIIPHFSIFILNLLRLLHKPRQKLVNIPVAIVDPSALPTKFKRSEKRKARRPVFYAAVLAGYNQLNISIKFFTHTSTSLLYPPYLSACRPVSRPTNELWRGGPS